MAKNEHKLPILEIEHSSWFCILRLTFNLETHDCLEEKDLIMADNYGYLVDNLLQILGSCHLFMNSINCASHFIMSQLRCVKDWVRNGPSLRYAKKKF